MPQYFVNTYSPQTPIGAALQNVSMALFGGKSPKDRELEEAKARYYSAGVADREAQARKHAAEASNLEQQRAGRAGYLDTAVSHLFGGERAPAVQSWLRNRTFGENVVDPGLRMTGDDEGNVLPAESQIQVSPRVTAPVTERPSWFTPELERETMREAALARLIMAGGGNADQLAKAGGHLQDQGYERDLVSGRMSPRTFFQLGRKPVQGVDEGYLVDLTGETRMPTELGTATSRIFRDRAAGGASQAQARASGAHARLYDAQADRERARGSRTSVHVPGMGPVLVSDDDLSRAASAALFPRPRTAPTDKPLRPSKQDRDAITAELNAFKGDGNVDTPFADAAASNRLMAAALKHFSTPGSDAYGNHALAADMAFQEVFPQGVELTGNWNPFRSNRMSARGGAAPAAGVSEQPAATAGALPAAARAKLKEGVVTTFGNGTSWTLQNGQPVQVQ